MIKNIILATIAALILLGCFGSTHTFSIRFNNIQGLRKNDRVFFDKTPIGVVTEVEYTDAGKYLVKVSVEDQYSSLPKDNGTFYIDANPRADGQKAVWITQIKDGGSPIEKNAIIEGQSKFSALYGRIASSFQQNFLSMESEINAFFASLQDFSESEQIRQIENQLDKILAEIENLNADLKQRLETDILPRITAQIEELRRKLKQSGTEEKLKYVDRKIKTISAKL